MLKALLSSPKVSVLEQSLAAASLRHKVISNNIANVNTPGFKKSEVAFESLLQSALDGTQLRMTSTNEKHFQIARSPLQVTPTINTITDTSMRTDGNNVDVDIEMAELAKNNIYYNAVAQQLGQQFSGLKTVINGGRS
ncbi:Flagellar basal body rod protein FlgB [bioreactor metagenome]|uniref:Flagellar basal body rod protein FlgB n=1 Tax=bioreactor metagenome TaxID=1076179 RepID=A0A645GLB9_9ZZZZ